MKNRLLYHWSPTERRESIERAGLLPNSWSTDRRWKPAYICFADSPSLAWALSGDTGRGRELEDSWDLWMMWSNVPPDMKRHEQEYRVYEPIHRSDLWYVGSRGEGI